MAWNSSHSSRSQTSLVIEADPRFKHSFSLEGFQAVSFDKCIHATNCIHGSQPLSLAEACLVMSTLG